MACRLFWAFLFQGSRSVSDMADDLVDFRVRITEETSQVLEAHARADRSDKAEIARKVLADWAAHEVHRSILVSRLTRGEGGGTA